MECTQRAESAEADAMTGDLPVDHGHPILFAEWKELLFDDVILVKVFRLEQKVCRYQSTIPTPGRKQRNAV